MRGERYQEIWVKGADGQSLCALIGGQVGWLMYLRFDGDAGFSSRNPDYAGDESAEIDYVLSNGQLDRYPASWALPLPIVMRALDHVRSTGSPPPFVVRHDDSGESASLTI